MVVRVEGEEVAVLRALLKPKFFMKASSGAKKKTMAGLKIRIRWSVSAGSRCVVPRPCLCAMCVCVPAAGKVPPSFVLSSLCSLPPRLVSPSLSLSLSVFIFSFDW